MKPHVTVSVNQDVLRKAKECAGLIPFSRFVEDLLRKEIEKRESMGGGR